MDSRHPTSARRVVVAVLTDHLFGFSTKISAIMIASYQIVT